MEFLRVSDIERTKFYTDDFYDEMSQGSDLQMDCTYCSMS